MIAIIEATLKYSKIGVAASCIVLMSQRFTVYPLYDDPTLRSDWHYALEIPGDLFVYPFILWSDVRACILVGDYAWATVLIGNEGMPVVQGAYGVVFTVEVLGESGE